jgi:hypothetical protein
MVAKNKEAGTVRAVPGLKVARLDSKAKFSYPESRSCSNTDLATSIIAIRYQLTLGRARIVAELAGYGEQS